MLRIYFLQHWFNLSDPAVEEALYDSQAMRRFVGIDLGREPVPDETTVCRFRGGFSRIPPSCARGNLPPLGDPHF
jgi:IS5 family transposase